MLGAGGRAAPATTHGGAVGAPLTMDCTMTGCSLQPAPADAGHGMGGSCSTRETQLPPFFNPLRYFPSTF